MESQLNFMQHLRQFGLIYQRKVGPALLLSDKIFTCGGVFSFI